MEIVKLSKSGLKQDIECGMKRTDMATKYGLPITQLNKAVTQAGLKGVRAKTIRFEFVDDEPEIEETSEEVQEIVETPVPTAPSMY